MIRPNILSEYEISPCPFCDEKDFEIFRYGRLLAGAEAIKCLSCGAVGPYQFTDYTYSAVVEAWNKRIGGNKHEVDN